VDTAPRPRPFSRQLAAEMGARYLPLPGGEAADLEVLVEAARARDVSEAVARHLVASHGSEAAAVLNHVAQTPALGRPIVPGRPEIWAEVRHAVEREMALRLTDVLIRRLHLFHEDPDHGVKTAPAVARLMGQLLEWDDAREQGEVATYAALVPRARPPRSSP
ncbi:MAG: glycerol-3-phosphate dehydrogenase C-terminal domain-containing protein, partial [Gemmatimonadales bacterium]